MQKNCDGENNCCDQSQTNLVEKIHIHDRKETSINKTIFGFFWSFCFVFMLLINKNTSMQIYM